MTREEMIEIAEVVVADMSSRIEHVEEALTKLPYVDSHMYETITVAKATRDLAEIVLALVKAS